MAEFVVSMLVLTVWAVYEVVMIPVRFLRAVAARIRAT